ncbi:putative tyrosine-protein kinase in cps region [Pedobacter sp. BAL39]|uniref:GumC family protein n=1 Tax=Pedobacter sp. BAL39 TaxID=391596 RepID=UPI0001559A95|nr:tyrosine-protein kinase family protein [Pedobacter sp. BAL39]EDM38324.1 putative tyrosine-protein kinase in cps region [Pedobacter sp. BAL39]
MSTYLQSAHQVPDFKSQLLQYLKYWYVFVVMLALGIGGAYVYLLMTVPQYKITTVLRVEEDAKGDGFLKGTAFSDLNMFQSKQTVDNEMEVLRSKKLIGAVLKDMSAETRYFLNRLPRRKELYGPELSFRILPDTIMPAGYVKRKLSIEIINSGQFIFRDGAHQRICRFGERLVSPDFKITVFKGPAFKSGSRPIQISFVNIQGLAESYSVSQLLIMPVTKDANNIVISMMDAVPQRGVDFLNRLIERYNVESVKRKTRLAQLSIKQIDERLHSLSAELSGIEKGVELYKQDNRVTELSTDAEMDLQSSTHYNQQLASSNMQLSQVRSLIGYLSGNEGKFQMVPATLGVKDPTFQSLADKYNNLQIERQRLLQTSQPGNPLVVNITDQLAALRGNLMENLKVIRRGLQLERSSLGNSSSTYTARLRSIPGLEKGLMERSREQSVQTAIYHYLLQKREETQLSLSATIPTSEVVDDPAAVSIPAKPRVQVIYLMGIVLGLGFPAAIIFATRKLSNKVKDINDVPFQLGGARILGELSHKSIGSSIVVHEDRSTTISELFRFIRSNLDFMDTSGQNQTLLVTSTTKGEGKTFFAINLGITLSLVGKKVVLLEFDLRKPDLLKHMNMRVELGLSDYLKSGSLTIDDLLVPVKDSNSLFVIGCGDLPENPAELLSSERLQDLFAELKQRFEVIVVDTSPVGRVADAFSLAKYADASIYLVRYNYTDKTELGIFADICENQKLRNPMLVFNDAKKENRNVYRYGRYAYTA